MKSYQCIPAVLRYSSELSSVTQVQSRFSIVREGRLRFITPVMLGNRGKERVKFNNCLSLLTMDRKSYTKL